MSSQKETIALGPDIDLNLPKLIDTKLLIQANSGGGKSWAIRRILEQSHGKVQHIILDPEGEFGTLRDKYEYILAGKGQDAPVDVKSAALLAHKLLELNVSAVIDLFELHPQERKKFVRLFLEAMVNAPKELWHPVLVVIDEAHTFAPEKGESEALGAVIGLCSLGRKRGFGAILATQRISKLHKDAAAECNNKLIGRTGLDIDRKRAAEELGFTSKEDVLSLRTLQPGEFYAFGPAISMDVIKRKVGDVKTSHPVAGRSLVEVAPPTDRIKKMLGQLADLPVEAQKEIDTIQSLKQELSILKRASQLLKNRPPEVDPPMHIIQRAVRTAIAKKQDDDLKFEKSVITENTRLVKVLEGVHKHLGNELAKPRISISSRKGIDDYVPQESPVVNVHKNNYRHIANSGNPESLKLRSTNEPIPADALTGPEQRILDAIAWMRSVGIDEPEMTAVAFLAGYTIGGGGFNNPKGSLRSKGLIEYLGGNLALTEAGLMLANTPAESLTTEELHARVLAKLPNPEQRLLKPLLNEYPRDLSNEELAEQAGYTAGSGGFNNPKGRLRTLGLVHYPSSGRVKAADVLFPNI